jgi:hypothetical protein
LYYAGGTWVETPGKVFQVDDNGAMYYLCEATPDSGTGGNSLHIMKSSDNGVTWRLVDDSNSPSVADVEALDSVISNDGEYLHILHHSTTTVEYYEFKMSTAASSPDTWVTGNFSQVRSGISGSIGQQCAQIAVRSDGDKIAIYNTYNATDAEDELNYKIDTGAGWGSEQILENESGYEWHWASVVMGESDLLHIFYKGDNNTLGPIWHKSLNSSGTLSSRQAVDSDAGSSTEYEAALTEAVYWDDAGEENIGIVFLDDTDDELYSVVVKDDGAPETRRATSDNTCARGETTGFGDSRSCVATLALRPGTKDIYCFYADGTDRHIWETNMSNDGGWSTDVERLNDGDHADNVETHWIRGQIFERAGATIFGYMWDNASTGGSGQTWYSEYVIEAAPSTLPFVQRNILQAVNRASTY